MSGTFLPQVATEPDGHLKNFLGIAAAIKPALDGMDGKTAKPKFIFTNHRSKRKIIFYNN